MKNNQINGSEHFEDLKDMIRNHPSLHIIDLSNSESNVNKNKLRNAGVAAIIDGILESTKQGHSLINELNLSYNQLTKDCLPHFGRLYDKEFVRIENLNLSNNNIGPDFF
jgi:GH25 family lysozyme M1 (1,4-beta-N-acetylmuramidase)